MALVCTTSSEQHSTMVLVVIHFSRNLHKARNPLHGSLRAVAFMTWIISRSGFHHRVDVHVSRSGFDVPVFVSIGCCTRHSTPATKFIPIRFISFHILSLVNPFVPMSATFDSVETSFVASFFSSMACCNHSHYTPRDDIFQHPAVVPCHGSQQSHSGARVFSLALQLRDSFINKPLAAPDPCAQNSDSPDDKALTFCVTDHPSSQ